MSDDPLSPNYRPSRPVGEPVPLSIPDSWRPDPPTLEPIDPAGMPLTPPSGTQDAPDASGVRVVGADPVAPVAPPVPPRRPAGVVGAPCATPGCGHPQQDHSTFGCLAPVCSRPAGGSCRAYTPQGDA